MLTTGAVFGEIGMLDGDVRTQAPPQCEDAPTSISRRTFYEALDRDPQLVRNVIDLLCRRLGGPVPGWRTPPCARRPSVSRGSSAILLGTMARPREGDRNRRQAHQSEMAQWTAMSREGLNKVLNRWAEERLLTQDRGGLIVHDLERIDEIAEFGE